MELYKMDSGIKEHELVVNKAGLWDVVDWWIENYPSDIFVVDPPEVIKIRELMIKIKEKRKP